MYPGFKPMDIVILKGKWSNPLSWPIMWRSISMYSHCVILKGNNDDIFDATTGGIKDHKLHDYTGRQCKIRRYNGNINHAELLYWCYQKQSTCEGYDYLAWLGFATGLRPLQDENRWFCSELPYWAFQENGYKLTDDDQTFIFPSDLAENPMFKTIYEGPIL